MKNLVQFSGSVTIPARKMLRATWTSGFTAHMREGEDGEDILLKAAEDLAGGLWRAPREAAGGDDDDLLEQKVQVALALTSVAEQEEEDGGRRRRETLVLAMLPSAEDLEAAQSPLGPPRMRRSLARGAPLALLLLLGGEGVAASSLDGGPSSSSSLDGGRLVAFLVSVARGLHFAGASGDGDSERPTAGEKNGK